MAEKLVLKNTLWLTGANFGGRAVGYVTFVFLARFFTEREVGVWAVLLTAYLFSEVISNLGLDKIVIRNVAQNPAEGETLFFSALVVKLVAALVTGVLACLSIYLGYPEIAASYPVAVALFFLAVPAIALTRTIEAWHTAREQMHYPALGQFMERLVVLGLLVLFWVMDCPFGFFIGASALGPLLRFVVVLRPARAHLHPIRPRDLGPLLSESLALFAFEAIAGIYLRIDLLLVSKLGSLEAAGLYNSAYRVFEFFTVVFAGYLVAIFPSLARKAHLHNLKNSFMLGLGVVGLAAAGGIVFRNLIMGLFGPAYLAASPALVLLMLALPLSYVTSFLVNYLVANRQTRLLLALASAIVFANLVLNLALIPRCGITGAALAFLLSEFFSVILLLCFRKRVIGPGAAETETLPAETGNGGVVPADRSLSPSLTSGKGRPMM